MFKSILLAALCALPLIISAQPAPADATLNTTLAAMQQQIQQLQQQVQQLIQRPAQPRMIRRSHTLIVPSQTLPADESIANGCLLHNIQQIATIQDALACVEDLPIGQSGEVVIKMVTPPATPYTSIEVAHANGDRIKIIGDCQGPCTLSFQDNVNGMMLTNGHQLGELANFHFVGHDKQSGIYLFNHGALLKAVDVKLSHFSDGIYADSNASFQGEGVQIVDNKAFGVMAIRASTTWLKRDSLILRNLEDLRADAAYIMCEHCTYETEQHIQGGILWQH